MQKDNLRARGWRAPGAKESQYSRAAGGPWPVSFLHPRWAANSAGEKPREREQPLDRAARVHLALPMSRWEFGLQQGSSGAQPTSASRWKNPDWCLSDDVHVSWVLLIYQYFMVRCALGLPNFFFFLNTEPKLLSFPLELPMIFPAYFTDTFPFLSDSVPSSLDPFLVLQTLLLLPTKASSPAFAERYPYARISRLDFSKHATKNKPKP